MPVPLAQSRPFPGQAAECYAPSSSACLQEWRLFRQCLPPFDICHGKDFIFLVPNEYSSDVSCVHCWLFYHQAPVRRVWFPLFCTLPWGAADNGGVLPKSSFSLSWTNPVFSLSCFITFSSPSPSWVSLHWTLTGMWMSPLLSRPPLDAIHQISFPNCQGEGNNHSPSPSDSALVNTGPLWPAPSLAGCTDTQQWALTDECKIMSMDNIGYFLSWAHAEQGGLSGM